MAGEEGEAQLLDETIVNRQLTVDEVIERYVGSLGFSQILQVVLVSSAWIFDSQNTLVTIFTDARPSITTGRGRGTDSDEVICGGGGGPVAGGGGGGHSHTDNIMSSSTTVGEWGLICDRKLLAALPASLFFLGSLLGSAVYGRLADSSWGRKKTLIVSCLLTSIAAFLTSLSPNIWIYAALRFATGFARSGMGTCCLVLSTEAVGRSWRGQVGQYGFSFFTAGFLLLPLIAYPNRTCWRNVYRIISIPPFPLLPLRGALRS